MDDSSALVQKPPPSTPMELPIDPRLLGLDTPGPMASSSSHSLPRLSTPAVNIPGTSPYANTSLTSPLSHSTTSGQSEALLTPRMLIREAQAFRGCFNTVNIIDCSFPARFFASVLCQKSTLSVSVSWSRTHSHQRKSLSTSWRAPTHSYTAEGRRTRDRSPGIQEVAMYQLLRYSTVCMSTRGACSRRLILLIAFATNQNASQPELLRPLPAAGKDGRTKRHLQPTGCRHQNTRIGLATLWTRMQVKETTMQVKETTMQVKETTMQTKGTKRWVDMRAEQTQSYQ